MPDQPTRGPVACTIVARNYLPAARVLAASYLRQHPRGRFTIMVVDALLGELTGGTDQLDLVGPDVLTVSELDFHRMATAYSVTELCTAVKPFLLQHLLRSHDVVTYLDPDIEVFAPITEVDELAAQHGIVLTPHVLEPMPRDQLRPSEGDIMAAGVFNLGYVTVSRKAAPFLDFWAERLRHDAISSVTEQLFTDQRWVDNVPALFDHTVVRDPGFNLAYWNVYQRELARTADGTLTANGVPLRFVHFSGYRPEKPWLLSTHYADKPRALLSEYPLLADLCDSYRDKLIEAGYAESLESIPYRWNTAADGTPLSHSLRRAFRTAWVQAERKGAEIPPTPFDRDDPDAFLRWACSPADGAQAGVGMTRWAMSVWSARADLQIAFPDPLGANAEDYRHWCITSGVAEHEMPRRAVPTGPKAGSTVAIEDTRGVNVLGYLTAELGVGEMGRLVHDAMREAGLPIAVAVEESTVHNRTDHKLPDGVRPQPPKFPVSVLCVNADMTEQTLRLHSQLGGDRYVIGVWSWELEEFPEWMHSAYGLVDEVWTVSDFCRAALAEHSSVPVHTVPVPVRDPLDGAEPPARDGDGPTRFLFAFDYNSLFDRKNPLGLVRAFQKAFDGRTDAALVIKSINGDLHPAQRERLRAAVRGDDRITLVEHYLSNAEVRELFASADCYVSLHRSEGFGLTVAEAMAQGLPVITTNYGGSGEFLTDGVGWIVPYERVAVGKNQHPYPPTAVWAEPDTDAAAEAMRAVAADPAEARRRGLAGRNHVLTTRTFERAAAWVDERVTAAYQQWRAEPDAAPAPTESGSDDDQQVLAPLQQSREALRWRADPGVPSRIPVAPMVRRGVLRLIDHYDVHQRRVLAKLMDGVEGAVRRVENRLTVSEQRTTARQTHLDQRMDEVVSRLAELNAQVGALDSDAQRLGKGLAGEAEERFRQVSELAGRADEASRRIDDVRRSAEHVDHKLVGMVQDRDARIEETAAAVTSLSRQVRALDRSVRSHHELLDPAPVDGPSEPVSTDVGMLRLPAEDTVVLPWLRAYSTWEERESQLLDELLSPGATFVDIGAHVGYHTVRALRRTGETGAVFAVEPWQRLGELLAHNVRANLTPAVASTLTVLPVAAWDEDQTLRLELAGDGNSGDNRIGANGEIEVRGVALAGVEELRARRLDVVKVDAQGRDHRALAGLAELIRRDRPHVVCEFWPEGVRDLGDDPAATLARYRSWGYELVPVIEGSDEDLTAASDDDVIRRAEAEQGGFVTLWLRPTSRRK
ncbi:FkbM family methyltransferase [Kutzneria buriramensis]|uniref:FkbM family methyltransferase n=1 Tax=Kutzneria buriramensis TaxID=1045776 RepID=A0A3E0HU57_9PSEU|nr:FkbM family methyltransferase [Kutzneria buriramensis]REH50073.1 FkbM family methyltransferase [Kutzneria buriramensis]